MTQPLREMFQQAGFAPQPVNQIQVNPRVPGIPDPPLNKCGSYRVQLSGGMLMNLAQHPTLVSMERVFRKLPTDGIFTATPSKPFVVELGSFRVPQNMLLLLFDWRFDVYQPSGIVVGDVQPITDRSLALSIGHDVVFSDYHTANIAYQITPNAPKPSQIAYAPTVSGGLVVPGEQGLPSAPQAQFDLQSALNTQLTTVGGAMLPQRHRRDIQPQMPFTYVVEANANVTLRTTVIKKVPMPLAFFEGEFSGILIGSNAMREFLNGGTPCQGY